MECSNTGLFYIYNIKDAYNPKPRYKHNNFLKMFFVFWFGGSN